VQPAQRSRTNCRKLLAQVGQRNLDFRLFEARGCSLEAARQTLATITGHLAEFETQALDAHVDFPLFQRLALPIALGNTKIPGIKIQDTRMLRLMEVLLHRGTQLGGWRSRPIHQAILSTFQLTPQNYTLTQLRYDLRKLKAHALLQRDRCRYAYRLTDKGIRVALMFILFHHRVCGPLANSLFLRQPTQVHTPPPTTSRLSQSRRLYPTPHRSTRRLKL
jgi:hypothetical protein